MSDRVPVSVIIPNYNSGNYLSECILSINSSTPPVEIIIIDDCSTDGSLNVARAIEKEHNNVRVISRKNNGGAVEARRAGIFAAAQEWIALVDADDLLEDHALRVAYETALCTDTDICIWEMWRLNPDREWVMLENDLSKFPISGRQAALMTLGGWKIHPLGVSRKSIYMAAYDNFQETCFNADELLTRVVFTLAKSVSACDKKYFYRVNPVSETLTLHPRRLGVLDASLWLITFCKGFQEAPIKEIVLGTIAQSWWLFKNRRALGVKATKRKINQFIRRLSQSGALSAWILRHPKHLAALVALKILTLESR